MSQDNENLFSTSRSEDSWDSDVCINNIEIDRSLLYRWEYNGILVYDCYARLSSEHSEIIPQTTQKSISFKTRKEIESANDYGNIH